MNRHNDISAGFSWRSADRTTKRSSWLRDLAIALTIALAASILGMIGDAYAQSRSIQPIGKSEDVRTDTSFVDVTVGDPEVADVNPLTDHALSILGKKIGTTRVSVPITAHAALAAAQCKDPTNKYVQNNLRLLEESYRLRPRSSSRARPTLAWWLTGLGDNAPRTASDNAARPPPAPAREEESPAPAVVTGLPAGTSPNSGAVRRRQRSRAPRAPGTGERRADRGACSNPGATHAIQAAGPRTDRTFRDPRDSGPPARSGHRCPPRFGPRRRRWPPHPGESRRARRQARDPRRQRATRTRPIPRPSSTGS